MRSLMAWFAMSAAACGSQEPAAPSGGGSGSAVAAVEAPARAPAKPDAAPAASDDDGRDAIAQLVVRAVGSKALGGQTIEASCVQVTTLVAGDWTVAAARLNGCGDKTARSLVWLYKRPLRGGTWTEDYAGQPPRCWKGVPPDRAGAVAVVTKIPTC